MAASFSSPSAGPVDVLFVGSGINALVAAALLARAGRRVRVLERNDCIGGCIRSDALTLPGFVHDTLSTAHPLFRVGPAYAELGEALHAHGLEYVNTDRPTGVLRPDGRHAVLRTDRAANRAAFDALHPGDGAAYGAALDDIGRQAPLLFTLLGQELWRWPTAKAFGTLAWKQGPHALSQFAGAALPAARPWLEQAFGAELLRDLLAPWALHCGLGPDAPLSALMARVVAFTLEAVGMPMVKGGSGQFVNAFTALIESHGGRLQPNAEVVQVNVHQGRARGVTLADGQRIEAGQVVCSTTPQALYLNLLKGVPLPPDVTQQAGAWRHGRGNMQIHLALSEAPQWPAPGLDTVAYLHLSGGADAVSRAVNEAERGLLPAEPTICVAQPTALDPSRAPEGRHILWVQLPECPGTVRGDAAGEIIPPADGQWTPALREAYADRVVARIARQVPNLNRALLARSVLSPADLHRLNPNLVRGDPYGGDCSLDQSFLWRPLRATRNHATPIEGLWHIGASTHPGPGLGGASGLHLAQALGVRTAA